MIKNVEKPLKIFFFQCNHRSKILFSLRILFLNMKCVNRKEYKVIDLFLNEHGLYIWF